MDRKAESMKNGQNDGSNNLFPYFYSLKYKPIDD